ncbi:MAG: hypothetical protein ACRDKZ_05120 [Actinomycetota bacterium]
MEVSVAPGASVDAGAALGPGVRVGSGAVVYSNVEVGAGSVVGEHCVLGTGAPTDDPLRIGPGATIRSHSVLYQGAQLGPRFETGHHSLVRAGSVVGEGVRLGSYSSLEGNLTVDDYVTIAGYTQIGPGAAIGEFAWIFSLVTLTNDPLPPSNLFAPVVIGPGAVVCVGVTLLPGSEVGLGGFVAAGATVTAKVPPGQVLTKEGKLAGPVTRLVNLEAGLGHPWPLHFTERFPPEAQDRLAALKDEILAACNP